METFNIIIFSNLVTDPGQITVTIDGIEGITDIISSIKGK